MKRQSHLLFYIFINILISAATTLGVLWVWERAHPRPEITQPLAVVNTPIPTAQEALAVPTSTATPVDLIKDNLDIQIRTIVGAGDLEMEFVELYNQSGGAVDLSGWQLVNDAQNTFVFPVLILNQGGAIKVHSKSGQNTVIELYWQSETPVWQSGATAKLLDTNGAIITTYSIP